VSTKHSTVWEVRVWKGGAEIRNSLAEGRSANGDLYGFVKAKILNLFSIEFYLGKNLKARGKI
jgi:hypothetical protein